MWHRTVSTSGPSAEPVTLAEAKLHLKVDVTDDDALITEQLASAREYIEDISSTSLMTQTITLRADNFPTCFGRGQEEYGLIELPRGPIQSFTSVAYLDENGNSQTLNATKYRADIVSRPGRLTPSYGNTWPATQPVTHAVTLTYVAGFTSAGVVPSRFKTAIKTLVGSMYRFRENTITERTVAEVGKVCTDLVMPLRRRCINP